MVRSDPADFRSHPQGDDVSLLIGRDLQQCDMHHLDGVLLCNVSTHPPGLDTGYGFWAFDQVATGVA
jgi:hypothetical protein